MSEGLGETSKGQSATAASKGVAGSEDTDLLGGLLDEMNEPNTAEAGHAAATDGMQHLLDEIDQLEPAEKTAAGGAEQPKGSDAQIGNGLYLLSALAVAMLMVVLAYFNAPPKHQVQHAVKQVKAATAAADRGAEPAATVAVEQEVVATEAVPSETAASELAGTQQAAPEQAVAEQTGTEQLGSELAGSEQISPAQLNAESTTPEQAASVETNSEQLIPELVPSELTAPEPVAAQTSTGPDAAGSSTVAAAAGAIEAVENGQAMEQQTIAPQDTTAADPAGSAVAEVDVAAPVLANQVEQVIEAAVEHAVVKAEGESALEQAHANTLAEHEAVTASQSLGANHAMPATAEMPAGETQAAPVWSGWAINLVSYADRADAEAEQQKLLARNVHAAILEVQVASGTFYRVRITGFATKKAAMQVQALFKQENEYRDSWVNHYGQ